MMSLCYGGRLMTFNQTIVELKLVSYSSPKARKFTFNQTIVELKYSNKNNCVFKRNF